mgnify:FL=1
MYNNNNHHNSSSHKNGSKRFVSPPFHDNYYGFPSDDLPEEEYLNLQERERKPLTQQGRENLRLLQRFYISLIVTGVIIGGFLTWGVYGLLKHFDMIGPPSENQFNDKELIIKN